MDASDVNQLVQEWNKLNMDYQHMRSEADFMRLSEQQRLYERMELIEATCLAKHTTSDTVRTIQSPEDIERVILPFIEKDIRQELQAYNDVAIVCLQSRVAKMVPEDDRKIRALFWEKSGNYIEGLSGTEREYIEVLLSKQIIPFLSAFYEIGITQALGVPYNIYVAMCLRDLFIIPFQYSIKQRHGDDVERSDAEILINNYCEGYRENIESYFKGNESEFNSVFFAMANFGVGNSVTEELCADLDAALQKFVSEKKISISPLLSGNST